MTAAMPGTHDSRVAYIPVWHKGEIVAWSAVDVEDYVDVNRFRWSRHTNGYAQRMVTLPSGHQTIVMLARYLMGCTRGDGKEVDHIDRDRLNNRRSSNLRIGTRALNSQNLTAYANGSSKFRGVYWNKQRNKWHAQVKINRQSVHLGYFDYEDDAAAVAAAYRTQHMPFSEDARLAQQEATA